MISLTEEINKSGSNNPTVLPANSPGGQTPSDDSLQQASTFSFLSNTSSISVCLSPARCGGLNQTLSCPNAEVLFSFDTAYRTFSQSLRRKSGRIGMGARGQGRLTESSGSSNDV